MTNLFDKYTKGANVSLSGSGKTIDASSYLQQAQRQFSKPQEDKYNDAVLTNRMQTQLDKQAKKYELKQKALNTYKILSNTSKILDELKNTHKKDESFDPEEYSKQIKDVLNTEVESLIELGDPETANKIASNLDKYVKQKRVSYIYEKVSDKISNYLQTNLSDDAFGQLENSVLPKLYRQFGKTAEDKQAILQAFKDIKDMTNKDEQWQHIQDFNQKIHDQNVLETLEQDKEHHKMDMLYRKLNELNILEKDDKGFKFNYSTDKYNALNERLKQAYINGKLTKDQYTKTSKLLKEIKPTKESIKEQANSIKQYIGTTSEDNITFGESSLNIPKASTEVSINLDNNTTIKGNTVSAEKAKTLVNIPEVFKIKPEIKKLVDSQLENGSTYEDIKAQIEKSIKNPYMLESIKDYMNKVSRIVTHENKYLSFSVQDADKLGLLEKDKYGYTIGHEVNGMILTDTDTLNKLIQTNKIKLPKSNNKLINAASGKIKIPNFKAYPKESLQDTRIVGEGIRQSLLQTFVSNTKNKSTSPLTYITLKGEKSNTYKSMLNKYYKNYITAYKEHYGKEPDIDKETFNKNIFKPQIERMVPAVNIYNSLQMLHKYSSGLINVELPKNQEDIDNISSYNIDVNLQKLNGLDKEKQVKTIYNLYRGIKRLSKLHYNTKANHINISISDIKKNPDKYREVIVNTVTDFKKCKEQGTGILTTHCKMTGGKVTFDFMNALLDNLSNKED